MGHKVHPIAFRIPYVERWRSQWFHPRAYRRFLREDIAIRAHLEERLKKAAVQRVEIERSPGILRIIVHSARPGMIIGRGGGGIEQLRRELEKVLTKARRTLPWDTKNTETRPGEVKLQIEEVRRPETHAVLVAKTITEDLERRIPFRRVLKQTVEKVMQTGIAQGVRIALSGRLDGSEIARSEWASQGKIPLQTLRAAVDYGEATAKTSYGTVGVKVWIYKGEFFSESNEKSQ